MALPLSVFSAFRRNAQPSPLVTCSLSKKVAYRGLFWYNRSKKKAIAEGKTMITQ